MITDKEAVRFANEVVRPISKKVRALVTEIAAHQTVWFGGMNTKFPNDSTVIDDGLSEQGISQLTGADVNSVMGIIFAMASASNAEIISKPCVSPLSAN